MRYAISLALACGLIGCVPAAPAAPPETPAAETGSCGADALQHLVGQPAAVLQTLRFAAPTRIIRPGMAVTMDYLPARLNIEINSAETIRAVHCG